MRTGMKMERNTDGKVFTVIVRGHWNEIRAEDGTIDHVKWYGDENGLMLFAGAQSGFGYIEIR